MAWKQTFKIRFTAFWNEVLSYFNIKDDLESQQDVETSIRSGVSFKGSQLLTLIFAIFIASLGLNTNSVPVIIGAMLISPLMGPIIGMGLGIGIQDYDLLKRGLRNITAAMLGSILTSALYFLISPQYEGSSQLLARTSPSIYDVFVALFGGAAGILSIAAKNKGQVMPGVAIATSLMPPLCTVGYGLATLQMQFFLGALYLFFTNMIFILFATWIGVKLMGFKNVVYQNQQRAHRVQMIVYTVVAATIGVSCWLTVLMISKNIFMAKAADFVETEMVFPNTQVLNHREYVDGRQRYIDVTLIGQALPKDSLQLAMMNKLDSIGLGGVHLNIKQGFSMATNIANQEQNTDQVFRLMQSELNAARDRADSLQQLVALHKQFSDESVRVAPEVKVLFPSVRDIALAQMVATQVGGSDRDTVNMLFVNAPGGLTPAERTKLREYIEVRLKRKDLHLTLNPSAFPWPSSSAN
ncbi:MAG: TIGR00341 family protein [Muribaculaceae bacterium]|nr:TIGR00341 family protein [Bacteroidales bacterium]MBD5303209.1 TIGR00341 family protein [Bacteroides sp.]MDE6072579.1 TIGR00341 family protein [Muribaculaceae bacterium]